MGDNTATGRPRIDSQERVEKHSLAFLPRHWKRAAAAAMRRGTSISRVIGELVDNHLPDTDDEE